MTTEDIIKAVKTKYLISVIVCTHNRPYLLAKALESLLKQTLDKALYEIIVIDNASTDETIQLAQNFQSKHPECHMVLAREGRLGLGHARNKGLQQAHGEYIAFMDDDARANIDWLEQALHCFKQVKPTPVVIGGPIFPLYDKHKPQWFKDEYELRTWGDNPRFLKYGESFSGSNMIFSKRIFKTYGGFDTRVGVKGQYLSAGEETMLFEKIWKGTKKDTHLLYYLPSLIVFHSVPAYKMRMSYHLKRSFAWGQSWSLRYEPSSFLKRLKFIIIILVSIIKHVGRAVIHIREYNAYQNWIVERFTLIVSEIGRLCGCLGIYIRMKQK
jgi:glycosyltransferase involved in cell wall biosynthesis